jgi:hypothetical protein
LAWALRTGLHGTALLLAVPLALLLLLCLPCALLYGHRARRLYGLDGADYEGSRKLRFFKTLIRGTLETLHLLSTFLF